MRPVRASDTSGTIEWQFASLIQVFREILQTNAAHRDSRELLRIRAIYILGHEQILVIRVGVPEAAKVR